MVRDLQRAGAGGGLQPLLRGKNLALLCSDDKKPEAQLFRRAALELGAHVAHVAISLDESSPDADVVHTARLLGRLYDAVECQGMPGPLVQRVAAETDIAVYDGLAAATHPTASLAWQLGDEGHFSDNRRYLLQTCLLSTMS